MSISSRLLTNASARDLIYHGADRKAQFLHCIKNTRNSEILEFFEFFPRWINFIQRGKNSINSLTFARRPSCRRNSSSQFWNLEVLCQTDIDSNALPVISSGLVWASIVCSWCRCVSLRRVKVAKPLLFSSIELWTSWPKLFSFMMIWHSNFEGGRGAQPDPYWPFSRPWHHLTCVSWGHVYFPCFSLSNA